MRLLCQAGKKISKPISAGHWLAIRRQLKKREHRRVGRLARHASKARRADCADRSQAGTDRLSDNSFPLPRWEGIKGMVVR